MCPKEGHWAHQANSCLAVWLEAVPGTGGEARGAEEPVVTECAVLPSLHEQCACSLAKSETSLERWVLVSLLQFYLFSSHQTSCH